VDAELRAQAAASINGTTSDTTTTDTTTTTPAIDDATFKEWYRQTLNISKLSDSEFREYVKIRIMAQRLTDYLVAKMSLNVVQVHIFDIAVSDSTQADDIQARVNNGEDFQTIAREISIDTNTQPLGGDMGWVPIDVLNSIDSDIGATAASLEVGQVSYPTQMSTATDGSSSSSSSSDSSSTEPYYLFLITEKNNSMLVDNQQYISALQGLQLKNWLGDQMDPAKANNKVTLHGQGAAGGYDSTTNAWILYQIEKLKRSRGIVDETTTTTTDPLTGQ
jgi:hypothetical protein